jgi:hypothetical protein
MDEEEGIEINNGKGEYTIWLHRPEKEIRYLDIKIVCLIF